MLVVISGGSQGLGFALAEQYVQRGCDVVITARTESKLVAAVRALEASDVSGSCRISYFTGDASLPEDCEACFKKIGAVPDIVLCCAGAAQPGMFLQHSADDLGKNLRTVYDTALYFSHAALRVMASAPDKHMKRRHLVYCSSTVAVFPFIGYSAYAPAKAAIRSLSDIVRQECIEHNIRISHVLPGTMDTEGYAMEELSKPAITKQIEGASAPLLACDVARQIISSLENGSDTVYTDTISWVLGSMMMGHSPRHGYGILQTLVGLLLIIFGPLVGWYLNSDIAKAVKAGKNKVQL